MKWIDYVFDIESYKNFYCLHVSHVDSDVIERYRLNDLHKFQQKYDKPGVRLWGMNNDHYDDKMIAGWYNGKSVPDQNRLSNNLIHNDGLERYHNIDDYNELLDTVIAFDFVTGDLMKLIGKVNGLKMLGIIIGHDKLEELPFNALVALNNEGKEIVSDYCDNDVRITKKLYHIVMSGGTDTIATRASITTRDMFYQDGILNAYKVAGAKLAELDLIHQYKKDTGVDLNDRVRENHTKGFYRKEIALYDVMADIDFEDSTFQRIYDLYLRKVVKFHVFDGRLCPTADSSVSMTCTDKNGMDYSFGIGGLHSANDRFYIDKVPEGKMLILSDVGGYYPDLMRSQEMNPGHIKNGWYPKFVNSNIETRNEVKKLIGVDPEAKAKSDGYKLKNNAGFGKWGDPYSPLYDFKVTLETTINGQMKLMKLIDMYFDCSDAQVINANTDGVAVLVSKEYHELLLDCNREWEDLFNLTLEEEYYTQWIQKSCNNYMAKQDTGKVKGINEFQTTYNLEKGMTVPKIIPIAVTEYIMNGTPIEDTVEYHTNIQEFILASKKSPKTYDVLLGDEKVSNINRYYKSTKGKSLTYHDRDKGTSGQIPKADNITICNDIRSFWRIPKDINYDYYINAAWNMVNAVKYGYEGGDDVDAGMVHKLLGNRDKVNVFARLTDLPVRCGFVGYKGLKCPKIDEPDKWVDNVELATSLHVQLGDGLHMVTIKDEKPKLVRSEILKDTTKLQGINGKMFDTERGFSIKSEGWTPLWGIVRGNYYDNDFKPVLEPESDDVKTLEGMFTSATKLYKYKKKSTTKAFVTVSKSKYETEELETYGFSTGKGIVDFIDSIEYFEGKKEEAQMLNLWKYSDDRAISQNCVSVSGLMLDIDAGDTIEAFCEEFKKFKYAYYTSASHKPEAHKFRFILPFAKPVPLHEYRGYIKGIQKYFGDRIDASSVAVSRRFYAPTLAGFGNERRGSNNARGYFSIDTFEYVEVDNAPIVKSEKANLGTMWYDAILPGIRETFRRAFYINNRHKAIVDIAVVLDRNGYTAEEVMEELLKVEEFVNRDKYNDSEVMSKINDAVRRY